MVERLRENEVNRLRQLVGMGTQPAQKQPELQQERFDDDVPEQTPPSSRDTRLFVKIDEHEAVSKGLSNARKDIRAIADTIELLAKAEKLKAEAVERLEGNLNILDEKIKEIEPKLQAPEGLSEGNMPEDISPLYPDSLGDLKGELERLKSELKG